jgi:hypothetical protein
MSEHERRERETALLVAIRELTIEVGWLRDVVMLLSNTMNHGDQRRHFELGGGAADEKVQTVEFNDGLAACLDGPFEDHDVTPVTVTHRPVDTALDATPFDADADREVLDNPPYVPYPITDTVTVGESKGSGATVSAVVSDGGVTRVLP